MFLSNRPARFEATVNFTSDDDVRSGMSVEVRLTKNDVHDVLIVPVDAINYRDNNEAYVNVKDAKGNLIEKDVTLGVSDGTNVEVLTGLEENEKVYCICTVSFDAVLLLRFPG